MQPLQNNDLRKLPSERGKGVAGTAIIYLGVLLLMIFVGFSAPVPPEEDEGILVNFGTDETGIGLIEPSQAASAEETIPPPTASAETPSQEEAVVTQNFDTEAPEIKKVDPEAERKKKEQIEAERARQAEIEKALEEAKVQKRTNEISDRTKKLLANAKNTGTTSTGEGVTGGQGNQGASTGSVDTKVRGTGSGTGDKGISYDLDGRGFLELPKPKYDYQGEGKVVVEITVDRNGNVTQANPGIKGSTTLDEYLLNAAKDAALKAKFEPKPEAPIVQKGSITYIFILN